MYEQQFEYYLSNDHLGKSGSLLEKSTIKSRISNCKTVETHEGNLDDFYDKDGLTGLLKRLQFTKKDVEAGNTPLHKIPIDGDWVNGTATLRSAVNLYRKFRIWLEHASSEDAITPPKLKPKTPQLLTKTANWPQWSTPSPQDELLLAKVVAKLCRFLKPEIILAIVEDNEQHRVEWCQNLAMRGIDPLAYLWPRSACTFPGVRRYAGSTEIAIFRKRANGEVADALALDDNDYPKHLWAFTLTGKKFQKQGPPNYALAHLADHKVYKNRVNEDFRIISAEGRTELHGLFTAATNTCYTPTATIRPTDFSIQMRNLLMRRAADLYGSFCNILPSWLEIPEAKNSAWKLSQFEWSDPVGNLEFISSFISFRYDRMKNLFQKIGEN